MSNRKSQTQVQQNNVNPSDNTGLPDQAVFNFAWKVIILSLAVVLVVCFITIAFSVVYSIIFLHKTPTDAGLTTLQMIFTSIISLIMGLLLPRPTNKT